MHQTKSDAAHLDLLKRHVKDEGLVVIRVQSLLFDRGLPFLPLSLVQSQLHLHVRIYKHHEDDKFSQLKKFNEIIAETHSQLPT